MTTTHTHEWQYVEEHQSFATFTITEESAPDEDGIVWIKIDEEDYSQRDGDMQDHWIKCKVCEEEREIAFQVEWPGAPD